MAIEDHTALPGPGRRIYCNRTLNLRSTRAVGFDMDYTLVHYKVEEWERRAYRHAKQSLLDRGWPLEDVEFAPELVTLGLILDLELGNIVKANRFGYVKRALHGSAPLDFAVQRSTYGRTLVDLSEPRWVFMNTLFSLSEACLFAQCVDLLDAGALPDVHGYEQLYRAVRSGVDEAHMLGELKADIVASPERYVELDPEIPLTLMDLSQAGKKVMLITNSEWAYTRDIMRYAFDRYLPEGTTWRSLFDVVVVGARKPAYFTQGQACFEVVDDEGLLRPVVGGLKEGGVYLGGHAGLVEDYLGISGEQILYVGDHIFSDVNVSKRMLRWRTALIVRELEEDLIALERFKPQQAELTFMMAEKERLEHAFSVVRLAHQRLTKGYGPQPEEDAAELEAGMKARRRELVALDQRIAPLAKAAGELNSERWGLLMRAGNDKSHLARQVERNADIYTSRVSNLLPNTPFVYLRSPRGSLPHDSGPEGGVDDRPSNAG